MRKKSVENRGASASSVKLSDHKKKLKQGGILMALLPLAACGGGGGGSSPSGNKPTPPPAPDPTFTENPTNVFVAIDDTDSTLSEGGNTANLTVTGKAGADSITTGTGADTIDGAAGNDTIISNAGNDAVRGGTGNDTINAGSGNDHIRGGEGLDNITAGAGNDAIVVVGTTTAGQYTNSDITNSASSGTNLSDIITLADLNGRTVSEVTSGEVIDGGAGTNTLFIYGAVDLTGVTLTNVTVLVVNSDVTLTADQMKKFTTVDGDGTSVINIEVPPGDTYVIDLSTLNLTDIGNLNVEGDVTFIVDDASDLSEIGMINTDDSSDVKIEVNGNGAATTVNLGDIAAKFDDDVDTLELDPDVTLKIDDAADITKLGLDEIAGDGDIDTGGNSDIDDALDNVKMPPVATSDVGTTDENTPVTIDILANDTDANDDPLNINSANITSGTGTVSIVANELVYDPNGTYAHLNDGESAEINIEYQVSDGNGGTDTATVTVTVNGIDGVTLNLNTDITLTPDQLASYTTINGDGTSTITIDVPDDANDYTFDLTAIDISNVSQIHVDGDISFIVDDATDIASITRISAEAGSEIRLDITAQHPISVISLDEIAAVFDQVIVNEHQGAGYANPIIYNANSNFEADAASGFISEIAQNNYSHESLYLYGDQTGVEVFDADLTGYDLTGISSIYLSKNGREEVTLTTQNISDWDDRVTYFSILRIFGSENDIVNTDANDWVLDHQIQTSEGTRYLYRSNNVNLELQQDLAAANGFVIREGFTETTPTNFDADEGYINPVLNEKDATADLTVNGNTGSANYIMTGSGDDNITLNASNSSNYVTSGAGNDVVTGSDGNDIIRAGDGDDTLLGGDGRDRLYGGAGEDHIDGGDGDQDMINYFKSPEAISINLADETVTGGHGTGDTFTNIEDVSGTAFNDLIIGNDSDNYLSGGDGGYDTIHGGGGNDRLYGSGEINGDAGNDYIDYNQRDIGTFSTFDGGTDIDLIAFHSVFNDTDTWNVDFSAVNFKNIEIFNLDASHQSNAINFNISAQDVINFTDDNNELYIGIREEDAGSAATIETTSNWTYIGDVDYTYNQFMNSIVGYKENTGRYHQYESGDATLFVNVFIETQIGFPSKMTNFTESPANQFTAQTGVYGHFRDPENIDNLTITAGSDRATIISGDGNDNINTGNNYQTYTHGGAGNDIISGSGTIEGGAGNDIIDGSGTIEGGLGADTLTGSGTLSYANSSNGVTVDLVAGTGSGGEAAGDTFSGFSSFVGSAYDDHVTASSSYWQITTGAGDDTYIGTSEDDEIFGGEGADTIDGGAHGDAGDDVYYQRSDEGVTVNLTTGVGFGGDAEGDTLINIENVYGSWDNSNHITGSDSANFLYGGSKSDTLIGGAGNDLFDAAGYQQLLIDTFDGGADYDIIQLHNFDDVADVNFGDLNLSNMEEIILQGKNIDLEFTVQDIINITDSNSTFTINSDGANQYTINNNENWTYIADVLISDKSFHQYESGGATVYVDTSIETQNGFPVPTTNFTLSNPNEYDAPADIFAYYRDPSNSNDLTITIGDNNSSIKTGSGNDTITAGDGKNTIDGGAGNDTITSGTTYTHSTLRGGAGDDIISGEGTIEGGAGSDAMTGNGFSKLSYENSTSGIIIDLANGTGSGGDANGDTFTGFNSFIGSSHGDVVTAATNMEITLGAGDDIYLGTNQDDTVNGSAGADQFNGGAHGVAGDTVDYSVFWSSEGVTLNLATGTGTGGKANGDTYVGIENIFGYEHENNNITGDENDNYLKGGYQNDILIGGAGNDTLDGYGSNDILDGGTGDDTLIINYRPESTTQADGGTGYDILQLISYYFEPSINLSNKNFSNIEEIAIDQEFEISLSIQDVLDVTDVDNELIISGDDRTSLTSIGEGWVQGADQVIDLETYNTYSAGGATLLVDSDITQDIS